MDAGTLNEFIERGAMFVVNHSGGKDSQAMYLYLTIDLMIPPAQITVVHADLGDEVEWPGTIEHIEATTSNDHHCNVVRNPNKTFIEMVRARGMFPGPSTRQCTSDLKRGPIEKFIRHLVKDVENKLIINCMGMRAQESPNRAKLVPFKFNKGNSKNGREWYDWLPIHDKTVSWVFNRIKEAGQKAFYTYYAGMTRKSCKICILAGCEDIYIASTLDPEHTQTMIKLQDETGHTMFHDGKRPVRIEEMIEKGKQKIKQKNQ